MASTSWFSSRSKWTWVFNSWISDNHYWRSCWLFTVRNLILLDYKIHGIWVISYMAHFIWYALYVKYMVLELKRPSDLLFTYGILVKNFKSHNWNLGIWKWKFKNDQSSTYWWNVYRRNRHLCCWFWFLQKKLINIQKIFEHFEKLRGHPELNQGPLDLQSNALPLSYIPVGKSVRKAEYKSFRFQKKIRCIYPKSAPVFLQYNIFFYVSNREKFTW